MMILCTFMMFFAVKFPFLAESQVVSLPETREFPRKIIDKERLADLLTDGETSESGNHGNEATIRSIKDSLT